MSDQVKNPKHYQILDGVESIEIIARSMTVEQWHGFCLGNILKYRIRAGKKGDLAEDIAKADFYQELYEKHQSKCCDPYDDIDDDDIEPSGFESYENYSLIKINYLFKINILSNIFLK